MPSSLARLQRPARATIGLGLLALSTACAAAMAAMAPMAIDFCANLLKTSDDNYGSQYADQLKQVMLAYATPAEVDPSTVATSTEPALALEAEILRKGGESLEPIADGAVLHHDTDDTTGDRFRLAFRVNQRCYVYVLAIDSTAWALPLFPNADATAAGNPVDPGAALLIPDGDAWLELDEVRGIENVYFLASRTQRPDIEELFAKLAERNRQGRPATGDLAPVRDEAVASRGMRLTKKRTAVKTPQGTVEATTFLGVAGAGDLLVTRWFVHE